MKNRTLLIAFLLLGSLPGFCQSIIATYTNSTAASKNLKPVYYQLIAGTGESLFYSDDTENEVYESEASDGYGLADAFELRFGNKKNYIFKSLIEDSLIETITDFNGTYYNIKDELHPMKWTLQAESKDIAGYTCKKATTHFRGRNYTAWYAEDIPFATGPWKLGGLPGLIFDFSEENDLIGFALTKLELKQDPPRLERPKSDARYISHREYTRLYLDQLETYFSFKEAQLRKSGSDITISLNRDAFEPIEIYEDLQSGKKN